jgi:hypothetical protein
MIDLRLPPPIRIRVLLPQPEAPAEQVFSPYQLVGAVGGERTAELDQPAAFKQRHAQHGHGDGKKPGAQAALVAHVDPVRYRTHGAEIGLVDQRAHDQGDAKGGPQKKRLGRCEVVENHLYPLS